MVSEIVSQLHGLGITPAVLESDTLRPILTPDAKYQQDDRNCFYRQLASVGSLLARQGIPVIFDATANLRRYRDCARKQIPRFLEVYVDCPLAICMARDPKGIYRKAREGVAASVPGLQEAYEPPAHPDVVMRCNEEDTEQAARRVVAKLQELRFIPVAA